MPARIGTGVEEAAVRTLHAESPLGSGGPKGGRVAGEEPKPEGRRPWHEPYNTRPWLPVATAVVGGLALLVVGVALGGGSPDHLLPLGTWITGTAVAFAAVGQLFVARRRHEEQTKADLQRRITESFTKAIEQLGSEKLQVRLGGIYALERISRESSDDRRTVMDVLSAFVREQAPWKEPDIGDLFKGVTDARPDEVQRRAVKPPTDIAAVVAVLTRGAAERGLQGLDLGATDLQGATMNGARLRSPIFRKANLSMAGFAKAHLVSADFSKARLWGAYFTDAVIRRADFSEARLEDAGFSGARLPGAVFMLARLEDAKFYGARLEKAVFSRAHLERAKFGDARLEGAILWGANLEDADLTGAHLAGADMQDARGLTQRQIEVAFGDTATRLPDGLTRPRYWSPGPEDTARK